MNLSDNQIESLLRNAPSPTPPADLVASIQKDVRAAMNSGGVNGQAVPRPVLDRSANGRGLRRWWPIVLPSLATVAFATAMVVQQSEIQELRTELATLLTEANGSAVASEVGAGLAANASATDSTGRLGLSDRQDLERLRALVDSLAREVGDLEGLQSETRKFQAALKELQSKLPQDLQKASELSDRAQAIHCVNNMKQLGLAVRVWAVDHGDAFPPDIPSMSRELVSTKMLVCPADDVRSPAADWASYTAANCSYEYLAASAKDGDTEPMRVMFSCPFHGNVTLCDGSVQMGLAKNQPERFETRNGGLYVKANRPAAEAAGLGSPSGSGNANLPGSAPTTAVGPDGKPVTFQMSPELARRYGLVVEQPAAGTPAPDTNAVHDTTPE
jgi:hypothetical protein